MDRNLKLEQVMEMLNRDERFAKKLFAEETPEGAQKILKQVGIDFTLEEIRQIARQVCESQERQGKELDDSELEGIAGGQSADGNDRGQNYHWVAKGQQQQEPNDFIKFLNNVGNFFKAW